MGKTGRIVLTPERRRSMISTSVGLRSVRTERERSLRDFRDSFSAPTVVFETPFRPLPEHDSTASRIIRVVEEGFLEQPRRPDMKAGGAE